MILCDAGPLVSLIDRDEPNYEPCVAAMKTFRSSLLTTWPCLTEAMYLLQKHIGYPAQDQLWQYIEDGLLSVHMTSSEERARMRELMKQYQDSPMDFADASLGAAAEVLTEP